MTHDPHRLDGRVALVTGGSRGIGRATALALARRGADVAVVAQTRDAAEATATAIGASGRRGLAVGADVASWSAVEALVKQVEDALGPIEVLVNNAGISGQVAPMAELDPSAFERALAVNVLGPVHGMRSVLPLMLERGHGVVVNLSSGAAQRIAPGRPMYGTTKAALDYLTRVTAAEVADAGIRVYAIYPGLIDTDMNAPRRATPQAAELRPPEEVAACIAWLATPAGAAFEEVLVRWREPDVRDRIAHMPGFDISQLVGRGG